MANDALRAARKIEYVIGKSTGRPKPVVSYLCAGCNEHHQRKNIAKDHIVPFVPLTGWDESTLTKRLFVSDAAGYQVLCKPCHKLKTQAENKERREERRG